MENEQEETTNAWDFSPEDVLEEVDVTFDFGLPTTMVTYCQKMNEPVMLQFYKTHIDGVSESRELPIKVEPQVLMTKEDHLVAEELVKSLHPELLLLCKQLFVGGKPFDYNRKKNTFRRQFVRAVRENEHVVPKHAYREVHYYQKEGYKVLLDSDGCELIRGELADLLEFVTNQYPLSLHHVIKGLEWHDARQNKDLIRTLKNSRALRRVSKTLDRFSKVSQLDFVECDHPYFRYKGIEDDVIYAVNEDKRIGIKYRVKHLSSQEFLDGEFSNATFLINCVQGDVEGARSNNKLLLDKAILLRDCVVQLYMCIDDSSGFNVYRINKPRPHNAVMVVELAEDGEPVQCLFEKERKKAVEANEVRNYRFIGKEFQVRRLGTIDGEDLDTIYDNYLSNGLVLDDKKSEPHKPKYGAKRRNEILYFASDSNFRFDRALPCCKLVKFSLISPILHLNDPGFMEPDLVLRSIGIFAIEIGYELKFNGYWSAVKSN